MHANRVSAASDRCFFTIEFFMIELVKANRVSAASDHAVEVN